jgi:hypothetical protein
MTLYDEHGAIGPNREPDSPDTSAVATQEPPVFVSGGKRLNFSRQAEWGDPLSDYFQGYGKDTGCYPSCSWEELCAMADLIVRHPAFRLPETSSPYYPPQIQDEPDA